MSSRYRRLAGLDRSSRVTVDDDRVCTACGYPLRGLPLGSACPECGTTIGPADGPDDLLLRLEAGDRHRVRAGAAVLAGTMALAALLPVGVLLVAVAQAGGGLRGVDLRPAVAGVRLVLGLAWTVGLVLALPAGLWIAAGFRSRWARNLVLLGAAGWAAAWAGLFAGTLAGPSAEWPDGVRGLAVLLRGLGGVAALAGLLFLARLAARAELDPAGDRVATAAWLLPPLGLLAWVLPDRMSWFALVPYGLLVVLPWTAIGLRGALGVHAVAGHLGWSARHARDAAGREERIAARRAELDELWRARVRPLPGARERDP